MEKEEKKDARRDGLLRLHEPKLIELNPSTARNNAKATEWLNNKHTIQHRFFVRALVP